MRFRRTDVRQPLVAHSDRALRTARAAAARVAAGPAPAPPLEVVGATAYGAARGPQKRENDSHYQQDDPQNPQDVDREHESQDEQDDT